MGPDQIPEAYLEPLRMAAAQGAWSLHARILLASVLNDHENRVTRRVLTENGLRVVPSDEWTDDEWIRVLREFQPESLDLDAEIAVARWRQEPPRRVFPAPVLTHLPEGGLAWRQHRLCATPGCAHYAHAHGEKGCRDKACGCAGFMPRDRTAS